MCKRMNPAPRRRAVAPKKPTPHGYSWGRKQRTTRDLNAGAKVLGETAGGRLVYDGRNETWQDSRDTDPSKFRVGSPIGRDGGGGGAISGDALPDPSNPNSTRVELGFVCFTQNEYVRGDTQNYTGMVKMFLRDDSIPEVNGNADPKYLPVLTGYLGDTKGHPALELHPRWIEALRQALGAMPAGGRTTDLWSSDGLWVTQQQTDGNCVTYQLKRPYDKSTFRAYATLKDGIVDDPTWYGISARALEKAGGQLHRGLLFHRRQKKRRIAR